MSDQVYSDGTQTNLRGLNGVNITDATATAVPFLGTVGSGLAVDGTNAAQTVDIQNGGCTVICAGTGTRTLFKLTDGVSLALVKAT